MLLGVDHLVTGVDDLGAAIRDYAALGFSVVPSGRRAVGTWVDSRGLGLYAARFTGGPTPLAALGPRVSHGARLSFG
jgi:hypothetical protein